MAMIGAQEAGEDPRIEGVTLRPAHPKAIARAVNRFRVNRKDHDPVIEQEVDDSAVRLLDRCPHLPPGGAPFIEPAAELRQTVHRLRHRASHDLPPRFVLDPDGMFGIRLVHSEVVAHRSFTSRCARRASTSKNGRLALYRPSTGRPPMEPYAVHSRGGTVLLRSSDRMATSGSSSP